MILEALWRRKPAPASAAVNEAEREREVKQAMQRFPRLIDLVGSGARLDPQAKALTYLRSVLDPDPVIYTHDEVMGLVKAAERWFRKQGVGQGDVVAILVPSSPAAVAAILGASVCGAAEPLNLLFTRDAIRSQLKAVQAKIVLAPPPGMPGGLFEKIEGLDREVPSLKRIATMPLDGTVAFDGEKLAPDASWRDDYGASKQLSEADRVAVMLPTGGTTGHPKVARLTNKNTVVSTVCSRIALDGRKGDCMMVALPLFHVGGLFVGVCAGLSAGASLMIPSPAGARDPGLAPNFWKLVEKYKLTHAGNVPTTLGVVSEVPVGDADISSLRVMPTGASICPPEIERRFLATWGGPCLQQVYGMTEVAGAITHDFVGTKPKPNCVGTRNPLFELAVFANGKIHLPPWPSPTGELLVRGPQVFAGYVEKRQTDEAFLDGWLRTGDLCRIDADGFVEIMGRSKDVIIRGGHNIDPRSIEDAALEFPGVALAAAVGRPDAHSGEVPMLFVTPQPGAAIDTQELARFVQDKILEPPARPRAVALIAEMPVTPIGKVFKPKLRELATQTAARDLLEAEGLSDMAQAEAFTDPDRGLVLQVKVARDAEERVRRLLGQFQIRVDIVHA
jgi:fatty-acyl-CoA synthase